jgi:MarR family transcriptional regulator for hemolysin
MLPQLVEMFSTSLDGISPRDMQVFWKVAHQIEKNLIRMSQDDTTLD